MAAGGLQLHVSDGVTEMVAAEIQNTLFLFDFFGFEPETQVVFFAIVTSSSVLNHNVLNSKLFSPAPTRPAHTAFWLQPASR